MRFGTIGLTRLAIGCLFAAAASVGMLGCTSPSDHDPMPAPPPSQSSKAPAASRPATAPTASQSTVLASPIVMPDLVGRYWFDVAPELMDAGWRGTMIKGPDIAASPADFNRVLTQNPPAGSALSPDAAITLQFGS
ncbi:serine/threonine-protein kinase B PknB [Mycobacteroides abscessus subsp. massiliense]|nr:PASTA domain-containing protein [Mycobacteroides abscessus]TPW96388.1 PASTA domain-containing protein [Mycolicibacterium fortuitum]MBE5408370.1 hypothetical protein [Mycobacteroides abscessus]MBE5433337.1 hypothetical protein [Mycobacteroides abscessus]MBE5502678.1 hypothetical protein [Mycobacteroides abscessus]MBN7428877.1 PASTA domain-containing protein [Mycobacteroides abscessus subsp. massiliense]